MLLLLRCCYYSSFITTSLLVSLIFLVLIFLSFSRLCFLPGLFLSSLQGVTGNIDRLTKAGSVLKRLRLCGMGAAITGNLASLGAKCLQLKELHLSGTHVKGQLSDLKALTKLESLCLESQDNKLNGDISNLQVH